MLQQTLSTCEEQLSHDHPNFIGSLQVAMAASRNVRDVLTLKLYGIASSILPFQVIIGIFSMNVDMPRDGAAGTFTNPDGTLAGYGWFISIAVFCTAGVIISWTAIFYFLAPKRAAMLGRPKTL